MFGDAGHGLIMTLFGLFMVVWEKKLSAKKTNNEIWNIFFGGRYIILLMGLFSIYTGIIYNDLFSKSVNVFGSSWQSTYNYSTLQHNHFLQLNPNTEGYSQSPYPLGLDPVWMVSENKIIFLNSYKMKLSIIFGVVHMIFGVCMSVVNIIHFKKYASLFLEFLPQLLFLILLFLYMVTLMFLKWILYSATNDDMKYRPGCAPSVLITFINMMLFKSSPVQKGCSEFMFDGQKPLQLVCVYLALICIPVMLFGKPLYIKFSKKQPGRIMTNGSTTQDIELQPEGYELTATTSGGNAVGGHDHDSGGFGELMINQGIHTIEYVLSTISHTASYLRLWALSLAHAQLSEVLWNMVLQKGLGATEGNYAKAAVLFVTFGAWSLFTLAILVMMEGLSAFLHTLRLHWVEFMSKFYEGHGYPFQPFYFKTIFDTEDAEE